MGCFFRESILKLASNAVPRTCSFKALLLDGMLPTDHLLRVNKVFQKIPRLLTLVALLLEVRSERRYNSLVF